MKLAFLKDLTGNEILAKDIITGYGKTLLKRGIVLTNTIRKRIESQGIFFVYIEDDELSDVVDDTELLELKKNVLESLPEMFNDIIYFNGIALNKSLGLVDDLIDYIQTENYINLNLYEVKVYDDYTYMHSVDTAIMATFLGTNMNLSRKDLRELSIAALFHDIGKTKVPAEIINKPSKLTLEEFEEVKMHPIYGKDILRKNPEFSDTIIDSVATHHEKFDGTGYALGISGNDIPFYGRVISVCDVFTAITSDRCYRKKFAPKEAYEFILAQTYSSFDPSVINLFRDTFAVYPLGCPVTLSNGFIGYVVKQNKGFPDKPVIRIVSDLNNQKLVPYDINLKEVINVTITD
ncbi:MAG: HD-GYP domain-containing protein [Clostridium sp.]|nr:HD-GYP domain-containing protein [Clostridium sp.]